MNSKNVVNNVGIFNDSVAIKINSKKIVLRWTTIPMHNAGSITPPKFPSSA